MSISETLKAQKYASIAEVAAAESKLNADKLENAPDYAEQAAESALAAASSAQAAISAESVVNNLAVSASESATSAAASAASAGNAGGAAIARSVRAPEGEDLDALPAADARQNSVIYFGDNGNVTTKPVADFATLGSNGKIPISVIPSIALTEPFVVGSEEEMLSLDAQVGDIAKRTDLGYSFCLGSEPATSAENWVQLTDDVLSQLGQSTGAESIGADDSGSPTTVQLALNAKVNKTTISAPSGAANVGALNSTGSTVTVQEAIEEKIDRSEVEAFTAPEIIGTNHRGTLQKDLDVIDIRTSGRPLTTLTAAGLDAVVDTTLGATTIAVQDFRLKGARGGKIVAPKQTIAVQLSADNGTTEDMLIQGDGTVAPGDAAATYLLRTGDDIEGQFISNNRMSKATMGIHIRRTDDVVAIGNETRSMVYHPGLNAGGYGVLTEGAQNLALIGHSSYGDTINDRHALYISNEPTLRPNKDIRVIGFRADHSVANKGGVDGARNMPIINVRIVDGLIISDSQLRNGGQGINILNQLGTPTRVTVANSQLIDITKQTADDPCTGIATTFTTGNANIVGLLLANNQISLSRAAGIIDGARRPMPINLSNVRLGIISNTIIQSPGDAYGIVLDTCRDININNVTSITNTGTGSSYALIRFEGTCIDINVKQASYQNRDALFSGLDNVTNLTVDFSRICEVYSNAGVITTNDPWGLISSVSLSGNNVLVTMKGHVTQNACDTATTRPVFSGTPINMIGTTTSKVISVSAYTGANVAVSPSTGQVRFKLILSQ